MKPITTILFAAAVFGLTAGSAMAECVDTTASVGNQKQAGISKDGTHAPLETNQESGTTDMKGGPANKTGDTMPLANEDGGGDKNLATSQQDVNAQQKGDRTAAAKGDEDACAD